MFPTHTSNLPDEQKQWLHPEFLANEEAYVRMREQLLPQYRGQWVAVDGDRIVASGTDWNEVVQRAIAIAAHPYVANVGEEGKMVIRLGRSSPTALAPPPRAQSFHPPPHS